MASDKAHGILGQAELDLAQFGVEDFQVLTIPLRECAYEGASIEVHLRGQENIRRQNSNRAVNEDAGAAGGDANQGRVSAHIIKLQEDTELLRKEKEKNAQD